MKKIIYRYPVAVSLHSDIGNPPALKCLSTKQLLLSFITSRRESVADISLQRIGGLFCRSGESCLNVTQIIDILQTN